MLKKLHVAERILRILVHSVQLLNLLSIGTDQTAFLRLVVPARRIVFNIFAAFEEAIFFNSNFEVTSTDKRSLEQKGEFRKNENVK